MPVPKGTDVLLPFFPPRVFLYFKVVTPKTDRISSLVLAVRFCNQAKAQMCYQMDFKDDRVRIKKFKQNENIF